VARASYDHLNCSIARTMAVIGDAWTPLILRDIAVGITRFDALQRDLGISRKVLSERLAWLVEHGVLERRPYSERPPRHEYVLTDKGGELMQVLFAMTAWGDRWTAGDAGPPVLLRHRACGELTHARIVCAHCGEQLRPEDVEVQPGPGLQAA